ncbi:MAG: 3'-5' exonuclease, partial [Planctomycetota bacterium]
MQGSVGPTGQLSLTVNFRSQPAIVDFVNAVFGDEFGDSYEPLAATRPQSTPTPAVEFMWLPEEETPKSEDDVSRPTPRRGRKQQARLREAQWIARRLRQLIDSRQPLIAASDGSAEHARPLELGDVAILMRSLSDVAIYEEGLRQYELDYYLAGGHAFYAQQEIYDVLNLLRTIASSADEISLAGALRSPLFSLQDATLFWMVEAHGSLNAAVAPSATPGALAESERRKLRRAATTIGRLRRQKDRLLVAEVLLQALGATGYDAVLQAEFLGHRKLANIEKLVEQARALDQTAPGDLAAFIRQLSEYVSQAPKEPLAATQSDSNVVRIMTIHHAKGLEFPLVVLPDLERRSHAGTAEAALHRELGPVVPGGDAGSLGWD